MSAKQKILNYLSKDSGYNTLTAAQIRARFGITNVGARIEELRSEGHCIYTNKKTLDRKSTRLNSSHIPLSRMPSSA